MRFLRTFSHSKGTIASRLNAKHCSETRNDCTIARLATTQTKYEICPKAMQYMLILGIRYHSLSIVLYPPPALGQPF